MKDLDVAAFIDPTTVGFTDLTAKGTAVLEQNFEFATNLSNEIYVLGKGRVQWSGSASDLIENGDVTRTWLGV